MSVLLKRYGGRCGMVLAAVLGIATLTAAPKPADAHLWVGAGFGPGYYYQPYHPTYYYRPHYGYAYRPYWRAHWRWRHRHWCYWHPYACRY